MEFGYRKPRGGVIHFPSPFFETVSDLVINDFWWLLLQYVLMAREMRKMGIMHDDTLERRLPRQMINIIVTLKYNVRDSVLLEHDDSPRSIIDC